MDQQKREAPQRQLTAEEIDLTRKFQHIMNPKGGHIDPEKVKRITEFYSAPNRVPKQAEAKVVNNPCKKCNFLDDKICLEYGCQLKK